MKPILVALSLLLSLSLFAQENQRWKVADVVNQESLSGAVFSPDHQKVAWLKRRPSKKKDGFVTDLWVTYLNKQDETGKPKSVRLTRSDTHSDRNPIFSADGETIYYLSSKGGGKVIYAMSLWGGAPYAVDSFKTSIRSLSRWNDSTLLFLAQEGQTLYEAELKKKKDNVQVIEDTAHFKATRLFAYDLKQKKRRRLTDNRFPIGSYAYSSDGRWVVTSHVRSPHYGSDAQPPMVYYLWDLVEKSHRSILQGLQTPGSFQFTEDNRGFYFTATESSDPEWTGSGVERLHYFDLKKGTQEKIELSWDWGIGGAYRVKGNDVMVSLANGTTNRWAMYRRQDGNWGNLQVNTGDLKEHISLVALAKKGDVAIFNHSTASQPPRYVMVDIQEAKGLVKIEEKGELVKLNAHLDKKTKAKTESITWKGALGDRVTGMLYYPHGYEAGKKYKLMVAIHGGPSGVDRDRWSDRWAYFHNLLAQEGCFIFKPNYHGSSNHGLEFVESIKGHYYEYELPDIISGIDSLAEAGLILKDSMAVMGWSNGAILTTMLTVEYPDLFLAATPGAGDVNWTSDFGTCGFGVQFDQSYFGGAPYDDTDSTIFNPNYVLKSPLFELEKVRTPTLIFHGSEDRAVPRDQGWEYYRALQQVGKAPVRFLWFPGQPHGLQKLTHQTRKIEEEMNWFKKYFFGTYLAPNEAFKAGSPLAVLIKQQAWPRQDGRLGEMYQKTLIPAVDTVEEDSIAIGVFEVTHAQYQQFNPKHRFPADQLNHPVSGITRQQAQAYLKWLSEETGRSYRLPGTAEAKALHKIALQAGPKENTLRHWAGYDLVVDEVADLRLKLQDVDGTLIKAVGQFKGAKVGGATLYDLGGNVAEWAQESTYGFAAYDYVDSASSESVSDQSRNIGFRVVLELD